MDRFKTAILILGLALAGCTVTPKIKAPPTQPSYSGNEANGGVISLGPPAHVTAQWLVDYGFLLKWGYGKDGDPPVTDKSKGITMLADGTATVDDEHLSDKNVFATLKRNGIAP
jgi:hypothetical protein